MNDRFGRNIEYLRISVTQKCNMKCIYCSEWSLLEGEGKNCNNIYLTSQEIARLVEAMSELGIKKVRITGGEPLLRNDICQIIKNISNCKKIEDISLTTNAYLLDNMCKDLKEAGLHRINISLDSLKKERISSICGIKDASKVFKGIESALTVGLNPIRVNTVLLKGINEDEIQDFFNIARDYPIDVRFIELMPLSEYGTKNKDKLVKNNMILKQYPQLKPVYNIQKGGPAKYYTIDGFKGKIGFISPISHTFCNECNRIRVTCDGKLRPCLGDNGEVDILKNIREDDKLIKTLQDIIYQKPEGHCFLENFEPVRKMNAIGG